MEDNSTKFVHFPLGEGRVTAAIREDKESGLATIGVAFCSPNDQFSRKRGRLISEGRLNKGKWFCTLKLDGESPLHLQVVDRFFRIVNSGVASALPQWARE